MRFVLSFILLTLITLPAFACGYEGAWSYPLGKEVPYTYKSERFEIYPLHLAETVSANRAERAGIKKITRVNQDFDTTQCGFTFPLGYGFIHLDFLTNTLGRIEQHMQSGNTNPFCILEIGAAKGYHAEMFLRAFNHRFKEHPLVKGKDFSKQKLVHYVINEFAEDMHEILDGRFAGWHETHPIKFLLNKKSVLEHLEKTQMKYDVITSFLVFHFFKPVDYVEALIGCHAHLNKGGQLYIIQNLLHFNNKKSFMGQALQARQEAGELFPSLYLDEEFFLYEARRCYKSNKKEYPLIEWHNCLDTHNISSVEFEAESLKSLLERCQFNVTKAINCFFFQKDTVEAIATKDGEMDLETQSALRFKAKEEEAQAQSFLAKCHKEQEKSNFALPRKKDMSPRLKQFYEDEKSLDIQIQLLILKPQKQNTPQN